MLSKVQSAHRGRSAEAARIQAHTECSNEPPTHTSNIRSSRRAPPRLQLRGVGHARDRLDDRAHNLGRLGLGDLGEQRPQVRQQLPERRRVLLLRVQVAELLDGLRARRVFFRA